MRYRYPGIRGGVAFLLLSALLPLLGACESAQAREDEDRILEYVAANGLAAQATPEGVYYVIDVEGTGPNPTLSGAVTVHYEGSLLDGTIFDSSYDRGSPSTFPLSGTIAGWQIGLPLFREGGSGLLIIPSGLAYGTNPPPGSVIPENAVLVFRVEVLDVL
jgi:FKBP-type peptidyl-prolyl cis-trans isomerase FkpA